MPTLTQAGRDALEEELKFEDEETVKDADTGGHRHDGDSVPSSAL